MSFTSNQRNKNCLIACRKEKVEQGLCDCVNRMRLIEMNKENEEFKIPCLDYYGVLNDPSGRCSVCGKAEWQHKI